MKVRAKICGLKYPDNLKNVSALLPDYLGFIFYPKSKRYMRDSLSPADLAAVPSTIMKTGVFVNESPGKVLEMVSSYGLNALQLHGDENPEYLVKLRSELPESIKLIKAFGIDDSIDWGSLNDYQECCDVFLFDTKTPNYGGSGKRFDAKLLAEYRSSKPVMMSGGIGIDELREVLGIRNIDLWGIDMNSKLEIEPGKKNVALVGEALKTIREYER
ncbi:MAG: phosphoribosylanthranilate isomerase [Bacteroidetes bacterium]|nr:phosphoribosylanthranilate isomerase [Bacteroidota bacterium]